VTDRVDALIETDLAIVGAGPAGIAAAVTARGLGLRVVVIDESPRPGGQIWRHASRAARYPIADVWIERLAVSGAAVLSSSTVIAVGRGDSDAVELLIHRTSGPTRVRARSLLIATGARELFLPFPGWTLPGVVGLGGLQALMKSGLDVRGKRVAILGSGPLVLPVAALASSGGARLSIVAEQAPTGRVVAFAATLGPRRWLDAARYRLAFAGHRYRTGVWIVRAEGEGRVERVTATDGRHEWSQPCDLAAVAFGLVPNLELARLLGCDCAGGAVRVDADQRTSVDRVLAAGEAAGVAGVDVAIAEGIVAGGTAAGNLGASHRERGQRDRGRRQARRMDSAFRLRDGLRAIATPESVVCRCEDVTLGAIDPAWSARQARLYRRVGMGPCQGRICGGALRFLRGWDHESPRPPLHPASVSSLAAGVVPSESA
jgi:NADPH-dependent 2,4-dienoyl-CoA reductase/sulfur reductase-like enzyme